MISVPEKCEADTIDNIPKREMSSIIALDNFLIIMYLYLYFFKKRSKGNKIFSKTTQIKKAEIININTSKDHLYCFVFMVDSFDFDC